MTIIKLGNLEIDIDSTQVQSHTEKELLHRIVAMLHHQQKQIKKILELRMIDQATIDAAAKALQDAANNIIAHLPPSTTASTPDTAVTGLIGTVNTVAAQLNAAAGPATPPPTP